MKKNLVLTALVALIPSVALANNNVGNCGWGSKLFDGQKGVAPQVLAVTTNGSTGSQTFGITSGTSGCTQDGVVQSSWKTAAYIDGNMNKLAQDMSRGEGESLDALAHLVAVQPEDRAHFAAVLKNNFGSIFSSETVSSKDVVTSLHTVVASDAALAKYAVHI